MITDLISDSLTRLWNASKAGKSQTDLIYSKIVFSVFKILEEKKIIKSVEIVKKDEGLEKKDGDFKVVRVVLGYQDNGQPMLKKVERISRPGRRVYFSYHDIKPEIMSFFILSTPMGILTGREAKRKKLGGEVLCKIF
jgi:small subunit ribosomal protein S8